MNKNTELLNIIAERIKFTRKKFDNENVPVDLDDFIVIPFFGDIKHIFILSSFILNNYKKIKTSKYIILLSYPGFEQIFPYVDEYWYPSDFSIIKNTFLGSDYFENKSTFYLNLLRTLNENFRTVINSNFFTELYENKFKEKYWELFEKENSRIFMPMIPSSAVLDKQLIKDINSKNNKLFVQPSIYINTWLNGRCKKLISPKNFYIELIKNLNKNNIFPIIWNNNFSYDLNDEFKDKTDCIFINSNNLFEVLPTIRLTGCCLDLFSDFSKLSKIARTPSIILDERSKYYNTKEYEIDDLINLSLPGKINFTFSNSIINGNKNYWEKDIFKIINKNAEEIIPYIDRENLPTTSEVNIKIDLSKIRKIKNKILGTKFIKIEKLI